MALNDFNTEAQERIRTLLSKNVLHQDSEAFSVGKQVLHHGFSSLSWRQRIIYLEEMVPLLRKHGLSIGRDWAEIRCKLGDG